MTARFSPDVDDTPLTAKDIAHLTRVSLRTVRVRRSVLAAFLRRHRRRK